MEGRREREEARGSWRDGSRRGMERERRKREGGVERDGKDGKRRSNGRREDRAEREWERRRGPNNRTGITLEFTTPQYCPR